MGIHQKIKDAIDSSIAEIEDVSGCKVNHIETSYFPTKFYKYEGRKIPVIVKKECPDGLIYFLISEIGASNGNA